MSKELSQQDKQVEPASRRTVAYIDGYNLYCGRLRGTSYKWLDVVALFDHILILDNPAPSSGSYVVRNADCHTKSIALVHASLTR